MIFVNLSSKVLDVDELDKIQQIIVMTLCDMEKKFVPSFFTIKIHLMVHLVEEVKLGGPVHYRWMYPMERHALVKNRAHPEGSIAKGYRLKECMTFCSRFLEGNTRFTRPSRNPEPSDKMKEMSLFDSAGEPIGKANNVNQFDSQLLIQAHRYVLRHCDELEDFRQYVIIILGDGVGISKKVRALAAKPSRFGVRYSGYIINGFRFHTMSREAARLTQKSGEVNIADDGLNYYG
ncbi:hypothetical protein U9M48_005311 [Paspalum notatum var. saurae]|uniref:DUF4218 domain-containing protein n=1 Tax=Paspalum notatum var. saurae TaxID=547442 RepID=A0AAQ3SIE6_PASNO